MKGEAKFQKGKLRPKMPHKGEGHPFLVKQKYRLFLCHVKLKLIFKSQNLGMFS